MDVKEMVHEGLRKEVFKDGEVLAEGKSVEQWWDRLPGKRRAKVVGILGMSKGKNNSVFGKLDPDEQAEISAYFKKHKGKVEEVDPKGSESEL